MAKYLNLAGLQTLWTKAKNTFVPKTRKINDKELSSDVNLVLGDIVPIVSKTFSNVIGSAADQANANFFFGKLTPSDKSVYVQCRARYRLYAWIHDASKIPSTDTNKTNNVYTRGWFDVEINVRGETLVVYKVWNNHSSTSYKTITYHELGRAKSATIQAGGGHILGVRTRDAYSPVATGWNRDYRIDILELENCTFEFFDEMKTHSVAYTSDFVALSEIDGTNNGLRESGDDNDTSTINSSSTGYVVGTNGMQKYALCAIDKDGKLQSFTKTSGTSTTKTVNDAKFKFPLVLYRYNQSTDRADGYYFKDNWIQKIVASFDARYSCNRGTVFNSNAGPVYLEGTIDDDGYFSVSSNILTQTFSEGKVYVHVGHPYNAGAAATNVYNINLDATHPAYYYDGTNLVPFEEGRYAKKTELASKQDALTAQTAYSAKGSATKVPKITTNSLGQVTAIEEVTITQPDVSGKADDTAVVHMSGTETVTGVKTFSNSTTNIVNPQATDITRLRVFKPGETNLNGGVRLQLEYDPDGGRGLWDSNISENDGNVLWIDAGGQVRLHGTADLAGGVTTNGKTNSVTSESTLCLTSGGAFSNLLRKGTVGGFLVFKSTVRKQFGNRNTWYNLSQSLPFAMPPKSAVLLTFSVVPMNADQSLSPAYAFTARFYCGTSGPPADGTKDIYIYDKQMTTGANHILPILAVNDSNETQNFYLWAKAKDSAGVNFHLDGGTIWGTGLYGPDFITI